MTTDTQPRLKNAFADVVEIGRPRFLLCTSYS